MAYHLDDTIAAIASAAGGAARGIVRVSGPAAREVVARMFTADQGLPLEQVEFPMAVPGQLTLPCHGERSQQLPCDLFLWPNDRSYTRQPVAELHTIGSPPLLQSLLAELCRHGARLAEPGEFTLRAFLAGRIDLTQAEAVLGVIDAQHSGQLRTALDQLAGGLAKPLDRLRAELLYLLAELEAGLDFVEEDIEFISAAEVVSRLRAIVETLQEISAQLGSRGVEVEVYQVALVGPPNAGKSSLFNAMTKRFASATTSASSAIISDICGTTRDYLTATIDLAGVACTLIDTAGIESGGGENSDGRTTEIIAAAQSLTGEVRQQATLRALCVDASAFGTSAIEHDLLIFTKSDQADSVPVNNRSISAVPVVITSSVTGEGLDELRVAIRELLNASNRADQAVAATADRCRDSLRAAESALVRATEIAESRAGNELVAAELRTALTEIGKVVGAVYTDDILDRIFSTFCIGK
jgi:tRNA modification GTPase